jgi:hypothetical protein
MKPFRFEIKNKKIFKRKVNLNSNFNNDKNPIYNQSLFSSINIISERKLKESKENKNQINIKKIEAKSPREPIYINLKTSKKNRDKSKEDSYQKLKKIANLFSSRLSNRRLDKYNNDNDFYSDSCVLPRVISFNENSEIIKNKVESNFIYSNPKFPNTPNFPVIKKINIIEKSPRNIIINNNNYYIILKKPNPIKNIKNNKISGYKSIYLSFNLEKQKEPDVIQRFKNSLKRRYLQLKKPKNKRFYDFNSIKELYKNKSDINILKNKNNNNSKNNIENEEDLDTDLILNDKGTLINFNDVLNK